MVKTSKGKRKREETASWQVILCLLLQVSLRAQTKGPSLEYFPFYKHRGKTENHVK